MCGFLMEYAVYEPIDACVVLGGVVEECTESLWNNYIGGSLDRESSSQVAARRSSSGASPSLLTQWHRQFTLSVLLGGGIIFLLTGLHIIPVAFVLAGLLLVIIGIGLADSSDGETVCYEIQSTEENNHPQGSSSSSVDLGID